MCAVARGRPLKAGGEQVDTFDYVAQVEVVPIWTAVSLSGLTWRSPYVSGCVFFIYDAAVHFSTPNCRAISVCPGCTGKA